MIYETEFKNTIKAKTLFSWYGQHRLETTQYDFFKVLIALSSNSLLMYETKCRPYNQS